MMTPARRPLAGPLLLAAAALGLVLSAAPGAQASIIDSVTPRSGSVMGGTKITIRGAGLVKPSVFVGVNPCHVIEGESNSEQVVCTTTQPSEAGAVPVRVKIHGIYTAQCREPRTLPCGYVMRCVITPPRSGQAALPAALARASGGAL